MNRREFYVRHAIRQSYGWNVVADYAFDSREAAERKVAELRSAYPSDEARIEIRSNREAA